MTDILNISANDAYEALANKGGLLIDVRTRAEWTFVGVPDLAGLDMQPLLIEWQSLPTMQVNPDFPDQVAEAVRQAGGSHDTPLYFLCRSGARSLAAAQALKNAGFSACYNIADGFEGPLDGERHRNRVSGWRASGLPWVQS